VVRICRKFPRLPVVVTENRIYKSQRAVYAAMAACSNLRLDLSALWLHRRIEFICREFGAERLVWGSQLPERNPGVPLMQLNYSEVAPEELALLAGGNMRRLLSWNPAVKFVAENVPSPDGARSHTCTSVRSLIFPPPLDPLHRAARERRPLANELFYDCHGHIGWCSPHHVVQDTLGDIVREMDRFGVRVCCVFGLEGVFSDETYTNDEVAAAVKRFPDRFIGFTLANLNHGERLLRQELERGLNLGMKGIKLINSYHGYPAEGPLVDVACEFAHRRGQLILNHHWGSATQIERLCKTYPNACFFTGHSTTEYVEVVKRVPNLFICTCPFLAWGQTENYVRLYGADRILFGSDLTDLPIAWGLAPIFYARIPEADKRKILGENLKKLLSARQR